MPVTRDIIRTWCGPRPVYRTLLGMGQREDCAIAYLMAACFLVFVAQWPRLVRLSQGLDLPAGAKPPSLDRLMTYELVAWLMVWPLALYGLAGASWVILRVLRRGVSGYEARLALFWALLAATPATLVYGLVRGLNGEGLATQIIGAFLAAAFVWFWSQGLRVAHEIRALPY